MLRNQDDDQLKILLSETYANHTYTDPELEDLLGIPHNPLLYSHESRESLQSSGVSDFCVEKDQQAVQHYESDGNREEQIEVQIKMGIYEQSHHIFQSFYSQINESLKPLAIEAIRQNYPLFLLSQPTYQIKNNVKSVNLSFSGGLLRKNILVADVGYCEQQKSFRVAVGTDEGTIVIFQPNSSKPQQIIDCFNRICTVTCVKWSRNMQYLAISNDEKEVFVYTFKQPITIQNNITYRILKTPNLLCNIGEKQFSHIVVDLNFISQNPFRMALVTQDDEIFKLEMKKHIINLRPYLTPFPLKFAEFQDLNFHAMRDLHGNQGIIMAVTGQSFITFCQAEPKFEVAMVYDKQKHGSSIRKVGFPHVSFRSLPDSVLVLWDKYLEIMRIEVEDFTPFRHSFTITHKMILPESTLLGGFLSNTLVYQINRIGVKIYATTAIGKQISRQNKSAQIFNLKINFQSFCYGQRVQESISNIDIPVADLRFLKGLFRIANRHLFICTNKGIQLIYFSTLQQFVAEQIQNNNWKVGLQVLKQSLLGLLHNLDQIHQLQVQNKLKQISNRYLSFLQTVIIGEGEKMELLWNQELVFIFNILLSTGLDTFLLEDILKKVNNLNPHFINNIIPFILMNKIHKATQKSLELIGNKIPNKILSRYILGLQVVNNDPDLPHQVNNLLITNNMLLELIDLNQKFGDFFTPLAVLIGSYLQIQRNIDYDIFQAAKKKRELGKLIAYSIYQTLLTINLNRRGKSSNKDIMDSILHLITEQAFNILVREQPVALFQHIIEELYLGSCLQALNQLDVLGDQGDLMTSVLKSISYSEVTACRCQRRYWIAVFGLYARRIVSEIQIFIGLKFLTIEDHIEVDFIEKFINKCQQQVLNELQRKELKIVEQFFYNLLSTEHICLILIIGRYLKQFIPALAAMLSQPQFRNGKIYDFIYSFAAQLSIEGLRGLRQLLKSHIKFFIQLSPQKACDLICRYFLEDLRLFIDDLTEYPKQQLRLVHAVLQLYGYAQNLTPLKVRYLELLASTGNHDMLFLELQKESYPLDQSLDICKKYGALQALAYLLVKSGGQGNISQAINVYFRIIEQKIIIIVQQNKDPAHVLMEYVQRCISICLTDSLQYQWFVILSELQHLKTKLLRNWAIGGAGFETVRSVINKQVYPGFVQALLSQVPHTTIVEQLGQMMGKLDLEALYIIIQEMNKSYLYQRRILTVFERILIDYQKANRAEVVNHELQGFRSESICSVCKQKSDLLMHYDCGHQNHPSCSQDVKECILCAQQIQSLYRKNIYNTLGLRRVDIYSFGIPNDRELVQRQIDRQEKLRRLKDYDDWKHLQV